MKTIDNETAIAVGEEAFRAGYHAALYATPSDGNWHRAWSEYEPSETIKDLLSDAADIERLRTGLEKIDEMYVAYKVDEGDAEDQAFEDGLHAAAQIAREHLR